MPGAQVTNAHKERVVRMARSETPQALGEGYAGIGLIEERVRSTGALGFWLGRTLSPNLVASNGALHRSPRLR